MVFPFSFLAGLLLLLLHAELDETLPGEESGLRLAACFALLLVPWWLARRTARRIAGSARRGSPPERWLSLALRFQSLSVPVCYGILLFYGDLPAVIARWGADLQVVQLALLIAPLLAMEAAMRLGEIGSGLSSAVLGPNRLATILFVVTPFMAIAMIADLLSVDRRLEVFLQETSLGITLGLLLLVGVLCVLLPLVFRWVMPISRELPAAVAVDLRRTAAALGFRGDQLLAMRTGHRIVNAALVGPIRWPRFLVLTDGLLALLDPLSLRGVVAHEVGHARANHPALLVLVFAVVPLLLFFPVMLLDSEGGGAAWTGGLVAVALIAWLALRLLAHRFEYEADQLSAEALGGASYCVQALRRVGELSPRTIHRSSFRHPSESGRIRHLYACEQDPHYRARFWRRGRWVRRGIYAAVALATAWSVSAQVALWPLDRATYLFYCGRFEEARDVLASLPDDLPDLQRAAAEQLESEVEAGLDLGLRAPTWNAVRDDLAYRAYARAEELLASGSDPQLAVPWLSLALYRPDPEAWLQSLYLYCRAAMDGDEQRAARIAEHLLELETPPRIKQVLARG